MTTNEKINNALQIIEALDFAAEDPGKHIVNDDFFYMIQEYDTKEPAEARFEAHKNYVDIQYIVEGTESIELAPAAALEIEQAYNAESDVMFFKVPKQAAKVVLTAGSYAVIYPEDAHKPGVRVGDKPCRVKKIVGKVHV